MTPLSKHTRWVLAAAIAVSLQAAGPAAAGTDAAATSHLRQSAGRPAHACSPSVSLDRFSDALDKTILPLVRELQRS